MARRGELPWQLPAI